MTECTVTLPTVVMMRTAFRLEGTIYFGDEPGHREHTVTLTRCCSTLADAMVFPLDESPLQRAFEGPRSRLSGGQPRAA
jgi:hypothetical protein